MTTFEIGDGVMDKATGFASRVDAQKEFQKLKRYYAADTYGAERQRLIEKGWHEVTLDKYTSDVILVDGGQVIDAFDVWCTDVQRGQALGGTERAHLIDDLRHLDDDEEADDE